MIAKFDSFSDLLRGALGNRLVATEDTLDLFAEDVVFEFPYAPEGLPRRLEGRVALADHLTRLGPLLELGPMTLKAVIDGEDSAVVEFSCRGHGKQTGAAYDQDYVSIIKLRDGRIAHYRDYWNPLVVLSALGGAEAASAAFAEEMSRG